MPKRQFEGVVVSDKADKTILVLVERYVKHPFYKKYIRRRKKYAAHDERNRYHEGDFVTIRESRPYSKRKTWEVVGKADKKGGGK